LVNETKERVLYCHYYEVGLPVRKLAYDTYTVNIQYYNGDKEKMAETSIQVKMGEANPVTTGGNANYASGSIGSMRTVMIPYAKVYNNESLTGQAIVELKRHDLVQIISVTNGIARVKVHIQSGNGQVYNGSYYSSDDLTVYGYMRESAFEMPTSTFGTDIQREVVEVAYTRQGTKGVYNTTRKLQDYYLDAPTFVAWAWYQAGINMTTFGTDCNSLAKWADKQNSNVILWQAFQDQDYAVGQLVGARLSYDIKYKLWFTASDRSRYCETQATSYTSNISQEVYQNMQPGDLIFFNYSETQIIGEYEFHFPVIENKDGYGYDHAAMFVGLENDTTALILECSADDGSVRLTEMTLNGDLANQAYLVVRPQGCTQLITYGYSSAEYNGVYYADIGDLISPVATMTRENAANLNFGTGTDPFTGNLRDHSGVDINSKEGVKLGDDVYAAADGVVIAVNNTCPHTNSGTEYCDCGVYGNYVKIQHNNSTITLYGHMGLNSITVKAGDEVKAGQKIGQVGSSGRSSGPHLHFELRYNSSPVNPLRYMNWD
jgi:murein DD-endopeptidase MepM/ murein hydrolase activator NlpD